MAWSQLGYKLYCFKQWYSPLTEACITQFQWLWVKYILIKMCKKWYPTEGLTDFQNFSKSITSTAKISKSKSPHLKIPKSKSPHFFHVSHFLSPISPHYKPHENDWVQILRILGIFSVLFPCFLHVFSAFFQLRIFSAFVMRRSAKNCGENAELRKGCGDLRYGLSFDPLGAGNYQQPQLPTANMADTDLRTEIYSLFMQILSTHSGVWDVYTTQWHVCINWTPPFDSHVMTFAARWSGRKQRADGNLQYCMMVITDCKLPSALRFLPHRLAA